MSSIIPTVFAHNKKEFKERFSKLVPLSKDLQIDFMDGKFVPAKSMPFSACPSLKKYNNNFEAHLMVASPSRWIKKCIGKGFKKIIFHIEAVKDENEAIKVIEVIKRLRKIPIVAINPETSTSRLDGLQKHVDTILLMGVHPGREHQSLDTHVARRIHELKDMYFKTVQIDGGVNDSTVSMLKKAGADKLNSGSYVSNADNPRKALSLLKKRFSH